MALIVILLGVGQTIFGNPKLAGIGHFQTSLSMFPFVIWGALRFGPFGAASVTLFTSLLAIHGTVQGTGPFAGDSALGSLFRWCLFADLMAISGLLLGAVRAEREKALVAIRHSKDDLQRQVLQRTDELSKANVDLQAALAERRCLLLEMNQISEERLKLIGQELHDGLGQQLTAIAFLLTSLNGTLAPRAVTEINTVRQVEQLIAEAISLVRSLSRGLYPVALETGGISAALNHLAEHARSFSGAQCAVRTTTGVNAIDKSTALNLYRIAQEAVCNAVRHGIAQRIDIELTGTGDKYRLAIKDNGVGFLGQSPKANRTLGLRSMQCRADLIGAAFEIRKNLDGGTAVLLTGPMNTERSSVAQRD